MSDKDHIIVIDDDDANRRTYERALSKEGYHVTAFSEAGAALEHLRSHGEVLLVITDLMMPGLDGLGVLAKSREINPRVGVVMITGHGSVELAVDAMKHGANDFLTKPVDLYLLRQRTAAILDKLRLVDRVAELESRLGEKFKLVGKSKAMEDLFRQMELVAPARTNVLIVSESGTGKELVANALHEHSPRSQRRFLPINCGAIPAEILESELFGHERGAFTGAQARKLGKFELADGGTLFLDEIGELPLEMQVKLLRVLEQRDFMRVGGSETIRVDIRVVAATNSDLERAVEEGRFRQDLYYRLKVVTLRIPPLRERREDIRPLLDHFLRMFARENERPHLRFTQEAVERLVANPWEGNVRELRNLVESLVVLVPHDDIGVEDLPQEYRRSPPLAPPDVLIHTQMKDTLELPRGPGREEDLTMDEIERRAIMRALDKTGGNRTQAAELLGIGLRTLQRKLKEYRAGGREPVDT